MTSPDKIRSAIDHIRTSVDVDPWAMEIAIDAMEKQIPKRPVDADFDDEMGMCPSCVSLVMWGSSVCYCRRCGQAIDWGMNDGQDG